MYALVARLKKSVSDTDNSSIIERQEYRQGNAETPINTWVVATFGCGLGYGGFGDYTKVANK